MGSMKVRTTLSQKSPYYISKNRRMELKYFCLQYDEWKAYLNWIEFRGGSDEWSDPTGEEAVKRIIFDRNVRIIEETAKNSGGDIWEYLLLAVTKDVSYVTLSTKYYIPCGRDYFYDRYHRFWFFLSRKLHSL